MSNKFLLSKTIFVTSVWFLILPCTEAQEVINTSERKNYFEPRISLQQNFTNNFNLDEKTTNGYISEISPGFTWIGNANRIKGFADYSLDVIFDSQKNQHRRVNNRFNGSAVVEAIEQIGFVDVYGSVSAQPTSAFGNSASNNRLSSNNIQVKSYKISPYFKGIFGNNIDYEMRYGFLNNSSNSKLDSDNTKKDILLKLEKSPTGQTIGWAALASHQAEEFASRRTITTSTLRGAVSYTFDNQLILSAVSGMEATDQLSPVRKTHSITGLGGKWRFSERTLFTANFERRYFGNSHEILFQHQAARTVWRYRDSKGISNGYGSGASTSGTVFDLLNVFYMQTEPDPVRRAQMVLIEVERLGLSSDTKIFQDYLRSTSTLQRVQGLSLAMMGLRSTVTFEAFRTANEKLEGSLASGDDFDLNNKIFQYGWNLVAAHRLTPLSTIFLNVSEQQSRGSNMGIKSKNRSLKLGFNTRLARKVNANFQIQRSLFDGNISSYGESSIIGTLTYRF